MVIVLKDYWKQKKQARWCLPVREVATKLFFLERIFFRCHAYTVVDADVGVLDVLDIHMHTLDEFLMLVEQTVVFLVESSKVFL